MEKILTEELLKQLMLIKYDRSKPLLEQGELKPWQISDRLGGIDPDFNATPKIFNDPEYIRYQKLSPEEKERLDQEKLAKYWKPRLCKKTSLWNEGTMEKPKWEYHTHEDICKPYGGTYIYRYDNSKDSYLEVPDKNAWGQPVYCGCLRNQQLSLIDGRVVYVNDYIRDITTESLYEVEDFLTDPHNVMMLMSIGLAIFGGPVGMILAAGIDGVDAALYFKEGDYFMGGLALIFLVIPGNDLLKLYFKKYPGAKAFTKKTLMAILEKLRLKKPLQALEQKIIDACTSPTVLNATYRRLIRMKFRQLILGKDPKFIAVVFHWLVLKGYMVSSFILKFGLIIGGVFYSWSKIAEWLGIKRKGENEKNTEPIKITKEDIIKNNVMSYLKSMEEKKYNYSVKIDGSDVPAVAALQYALFAGGYFVVTDSPTYQLIDGILNFKSSSNVKNVKVYTSTGTLKDEINNTSSTFSLKNKLDKGVYILKITFKNGKSETAKIIYSDNKAYTFGQTSKITAKWGFYDNDTKVAVENYQKENGLGVDGVAGYNTLKGLVSDINKNKIKNFLTVHNFANYDFNKETIINNESVGFTKEEFEIAYDQQRKQTMDSLNYAIDQEYIHINSDSLTTVFSEVENIQIPKYPQPKIK
jgi:hypothetical protein